MVVRIDDYGCKCELEKQGDEFILWMYQGGKDCEVSLISYVNIEELKNTISMLEELEDG